MCKVEPLTEQIANEASETLNVTGRPVGTLPVVTDVAIRLKSAAVVYLSSIAGNEMSGLDPSGVGGGGGGGGMKIGPIQPGMFIIIQSGGALHSSPSQPKIRAKLRAGSINKPVVARTSSDFFIVLNILVAL